MADSIQAKRVILFDFDGTLADTLAVTIKVANELAPAYGYKEIEKSAVSELRNKTIPGLIKELQVPPLKVPAIVKSVKEKVREYMPLVQAFPGVINMVNDLHRHGHELGILTSNSKDNVRMFLEAQSIVDKFSYLHSVTNIFGKSCSLRAFLKKYKLQASAVVYIGDEARDIEAARACGIEIIAVTWGYNSVTTLESAKPNMLINSTDELLSALLNTNSDG